MKSIKLIFLTLLTIALIAGNISTKDALKRQVVVSSSSTSSSSSTKVEKMEKPDVGQIWDDLFSVPRSSSCRSEINKANVMSEIKADEQKKLESGNGEVIINNSAFGWLKKWGFGQVAYLMDFWDPVFRKDILAEFKSIHSTIMKEDPENTPEYSDVFDFTSRIANAPPEKQDALMRDLKIFEKTYDPIIFKLSANTVQIMKAMKLFKWFIDPGTADFAADFVTKYDINHDGRLNPKELILGAIMYNKGVLGSKKCNHCFTTIARRIGALFTYLDCGETGFINADQLWKGLPELRRPTTQFNIFGYGNSENIRTNAINDFILKNEKSKDASVSKEEFVAGILLAVWDRQVNESGIIEDDSRNLKKLRWSDNNMLDTAAYTYVKAITKAKIEDEEKERYARWEKEKLEREKAAKK
jgi:hypothetical protein